MDHHSLCPRKKTILRRCQCGLIDKVIVEYSSILDVLMPDSREIKSHWYYSGRMDAAEEIENEKHEDLCNCNYCRTLTIAYRAALGLPKSGQ